MDFKKYFQGISTYDGGNISTVFPIISSFYKSISSNIKPINLMKKIITLLLAMTLAVVTFAQQGIKSK